MKKHSFKLLLIVLAIVLCFCTVLTACNKDKENPPATAQTVQTGTMLDTIISNISSSLNVGESFVADISAAFVIDDKTAANKDIAYKLTAKGNASGASSATESDTNFVVEVIKEQGESKETLMGIAYEALDNEPFFYINLLNGGYRKINGYSMTSLMKLAQKSDADASADGSAIDVNTIISAVVPILFGDTGTVLNNVYTLNFDFAKTISSIVSEKDTLLFALGIQESDVNEMIETYFGDLSYEQGGQTVNVSNITTLEAYLKRTISLAGTISFSFDGNNKLSSAKASFDYGQGGTDKANYTLSVDKLELGTRSEAINAFEGFALSADDRRSAQAVNILNFSLKGDVVGYTVNGTVEHKYSIEVQSDIDAFALLNLINGTSKENILATLKQLGYFHLEISEVFETGDPLNIITIHSKFEEGFAVVNLHGHEILGYKPALGGVYDFDALIDVIGMLFASEEEGAESSAEINISSAIDLIGDVLGYFTFDNMKENGVTIEISDLVLMICKTLGLDTDGIVGLGITGVIGSDSMNIKLQTPTFGTCTYVETSAVKGNIKESAELYATGDGYDLTASRTSFIKQITSLDGFPSKVLQGDSSFNKYATGYIAFDKAFLMKGKNLQGNEIQTLGFIMGASEFDPEKVGTQEVTFYVAVANDLFSLSGLGLSFGDMIPLFGTLKFTTNVEVVAYDAGITPTCTNLATSDVKVLVLDEEEGAKTLFDLIRSNTGRDTVITIGSYSIKADASMLRVYDANEGGNDVTADVVDGNGKFTKVGVYYPRLAFGHYEVNCRKVIVKDAYFERKDGLAEPDSITFGDAYEFGEYNSYVVDENGEVVEETAEMNYAIGNLEFTASSLNEAFDLVGDKYYLKKNLAFGGSNFLISSSLMVEFDYTTFTPLMRTYVVSIPIDDSYGFTSFGVNYFGVSLNESAGSFTLGGIEYSIICESGTWVGVAKDGTKKAIDITFKWDAGDTDVEFNADGVISRYPAAAFAGSSNHIINYNLTVDGYYASGRITAYHLYAAGQFNKDIGFKLDGVINNLDRIPYVGADGKEATLEFKYGAEGYAIYIKDTDTKAFDVTVTVELRDTDTPYVLTNGTFTDAGSYDVTYKTTINGVEQEFEHLVSIKAAA